MRDHQAIQNNINNNNLIPKSHVSATWEMNKLKKNSLLTTKMMINLTDIASGHKKKTKKNTFLNNGFK